jgi:hypothetical protein
VLDLDSMDLELCDSKPEPCVEDDNFEAMTPILVESTQLEVPKKVTPGPRWPGASRRCPFTPEASVLGA